MARPVSAARILRRGEIWLHGFASPDKRRPVLILSRNDALSVMQTALVAPITSTIHGLPSEVVVDDRAGLKHTSAVNLDHVQCVRQRDLVQYLGTVSSSQLREVCVALAVAVGCE